ncbi:MAG: hypothetical protein II733_06670 [Succinivibrio sp.]|nr:hypothetical protein [Succinivibrio sp.]
MKIYNKRLVKTLLISALSAVLLTPSYAADLKRVWPQYQSFMSSRAKDNVFISNLNNEEFVSSEIYSYVMLFALTQKDKNRFDGLLSALETTLCEGDIKSNLPYARVKLNKNGNENREGTLTRANLFIAYDLYTAYEMFKDESYREKADAIAAMVKSSCTYGHPVLGTVILPSYNNVADKKEITITPNIFAPFVMQKLGQYDIDYLSLYDNTVSAVVRGSGDGFAADTLTFNMDGDQIIRINSIGSLDALRFYLWLGITCESDPNRRLLIPLYENMLKDIEKDLNVPEVANLYTHKVGGIGTLSYMASTMLLEKNKEKDFFRTVLKNHVFKKDELYAQVMTMFALGFDNHYFRFSHDGSLVLEY